MAKKQEMMPILCAFFLAVKPLFPKAVSETVPKLLETHPRN